MSAANFTSDQRKAIEARGDTLVVAGAGAGKTGTLVERCLRILLDAPKKVSVSQILVMTFTEAAAAEVRERIRKKLESAAAADPLDEWVQKQMAGLDTAHICTLHSFCLALLRENFYALDLDPAVSVLPGEQAEILFHEVFEELLNEHFSGAHPFSGDLQTIMRTHFRGWEKPVREFIQKLHHYTQTRPAPEAWFETQIQQLSNGDSTQWQTLYEQAVNDWCAWWQPYLASLPVENENAQHCAKLLADALRTRDLAVVTAALNRKECWVRGKTKEHRAQFGSFFEEADFLESLNTPEALAQDWEWSAGPLLVLLRFARQFSARFQEAKQARGAVDFHDLEQGALRLLWNAQSGAPTRVARRWQERLEAVFVDEYQDINAAQDLIIAAVSRTENGRGNRFLVGDIKQSIYGFRQADPSIFRRYLRAAETNRNWEAVFLSDNFRSHEGILNFINPLFRWLMQERVGGIRYDAQAMLRFGAREMRPELVVRDLAQWPVELNLVVTSRNSGAENADNETEEVDLEAAEMEARLVAARLRELRESGHAIYHQKEKLTRAVDWKDMVVLLRAASRKVEVYAKAFAAMGVPLDTKRDGFFTAPEVLDLCNLLAILDNPLQDIPLVAVLRSPMVGMTANDLALVRVNARKGATGFWNALQAYLEAKKQNETSRKIEAFLQRFHRWRNPRQCFSLAQRLETVLADTGYADWLISQPRGRQRYANVQQLLRVARQFDDARGESLYLFLRHLQELQDSAGDIEPAGSSEANAVRLMTVHQSKGLEFPVVAVADLGKQFNRADQHSALLLHEEYGICGTIKPPESAQRYPSLPLWLAAREQKLASAGEEMRVLYVALTRAENLLLLFGSAAETKLEQWTGGSAGPLHPQQLLKTKSWLDWIGMHCGASRPGVFNEEAPDESVPFAVRVHREIPKAKVEEKTGAIRWTEADRKVLVKRISFAYPHAEAVREPAKTSVSAVRKRAQDLGEETAPPPKRFIDLNSTADARTRGLASHRFLQHVDLRGPFDEGELKAQVEELVERGLLENGDVPLIDWGGVVAFWTSPEGAEIRSRWPDVRREMPFTFKLRNDDLARLELKNVLPVPEGEFILTQGVADLVVLGAAEIWLIDFKTDAVKAKDASAKAAEYRAQISLYALALERIYQKPVTRRGLYFLGARHLEWMQ